MNIMNFEEYQRLSEEQKDYSLFTRLESIDKKLDSKANKWVETTMTWGLSVVGSAVILALMALIIQNSGV